MRWLLSAIVALAAAPVAAQDHSGHGQARPEEPDHCAMGHLPPEKCPPAQEPNEEVSTDHSGHEAHGAHGAMTDKSATDAAPETAIPARALEGPRHAADAVWGREAMAESRAGFGPQHGGFTTGAVMIERLEWRGGEDDAYLWDAEAWYGGDIDKIWFKSEGESEFGEALEDADIQALWSHAIGPWFDLQTGLRYTIAPVERAHLAVGIQGLAPYMFHVDAAAFLSTEGDLTALVEAELDQKITQRLILQPRIELELSAQDIPEFELGSGITTIEVGVRLRYEIAREFAPYLGIGWEGKLGRTADTARDSGEDTGGFVAMAGIRAWF